MHDKHQVCENSIHALCHFWNTICLPHKVPILIASAAGTEAILCMPAFWLGDTQCGAGVEVCVHASWLQASGSGLGHTM